MSGLGQFMAGALSGIRILDLSRVVAGPYVSRICADMGAEVIKVEPPEGDQARFIAAKHDLGMSSFYQWVNAGKRGLSIDLRKPDGLEIVLDLIRHCDAIVENFRPGVLARLGLSWQVIQETNPKAVLLSINGFGSDSVWRDRRAYAPIVHAVSGILADQAEYAGQPIAQTNQAHADTTAALHGTIALLAALRVAEATGIGQRLEVPLYDALLATYSEVNNVLLPEADHRIMNPIYDAGPHGAIATAGPIQHVWRLLSETQALEDPTPPGASLDEKKKHRRQAIESWMRDQASRDEILVKLGEAGVASAPVLPMREALESDLSRERSLLVEIDDRRGGTRPLVKPPARFSESENSIRGAAPRRGEHNREVLRELLGYDDARIDRLESEEVLSASDPSER
jgi:CoA:oxalate CoA-transferase